MVRIRQIAGVLLAAAWLSACASVRRALPAPSIYVREVTPRPHQTVFFHGPVPIECEVWISNVADEPLVLKSVEFHSGGTEAFRFATSTLPITTTIAPGGTVTFTVSCWGWSRGGDFPDYRRLFIEGKASFLARGTRALVTFRNAA